MIERLALLADAINEKIGRGVSWLCLILVAIIMIDVMLRYLFSITSAWSAELEWHLFAILFLLSAGWTLRHDKHVRVDVFYQRFSEKSKAWVNLAGILLFLLPLCVIGAIEGFQFARNAWLTQETSMDAGGLPYRFFIKGIIPISFILLALQGVSEALKSILQLKHGN